MGRPIKNSEGNHKDFLNIGRNTVEGCGVCPGILSWLWWLCWIGSFKHLIRLPSNKQRLKIKIKNPRWVRSEDSRCDFGPADQMLSNGTYVQNWVNGGVRPSVWDTNFAGADSVGFAWLWVQQWQWWVSWSQITAKPRVILESGVDSWILSQKL